MINQIVEAIEQAGSQGGHTSPSQWIRRYEPREDYRTNQFVVFLKPEATAIQRGAKTDMVLDILFNAFNTWQVQVEAIRFLTSDYLRQYQLMDRHYGVINEISKRGAEAISSSAHEALNEYYPSDLEAGVEILGGHQFLERFPDFSPLSLSTISDNIGTKKLAGGTYSLRIKVDGVPFILLNPFHPFQLEYFTAAGRSILVFEGASDTHWSVLRQEMIGSTNPANAAEGSIRQTLLKKQQELGLPQMNQGVNGVHLSAGPIEGMLELQRFFSEPESGLRVDLQQTSFGRLLLSGASKAFLLSLAENPVLNIDGKSIPAFDYTEELDAHEAAEKLLSLSKND